MKLIEFQNHYLFILFQLNCYLMSHVYNIQAKGERDAWNKLNWAPREKDVLVYCESRFLINWRLDTCSTIHVYNSSSRRSLP